MSLDELTVNQRYPFGPAVIPSTCGKWSERSGISVMRPLDGLMNPNWPAFSSKNQ